ncbi:MAG: transposase [Candidatus Omnitrophota bacterium]
MQKRIFYNDKIYHVFSKSIFKFKIFRVNDEFERMKSLIWFYKREKPVVRYSHFLELKNKDRFYKENVSDNNELVEIIAYCIMPTHIHIVLKQVIDKGISTFLSNVFNSYTRYFNFKIKRKGPLWESRFKGVSVDTDEQLLHLTRYVHLNPVTAKLINHPEDWKYSSYKEFIGVKSTEKPICSFSGCMDINPSVYKKFVNSQIDYQRELADIKAKFLD